MDFHGMKRKELQALCRKHSIPANLSNLEMANKLSSLLHEKERPMMRSRSCLKSSAEIGIGNDFDVVNREIKKVRFSPDNETFEFVTSAERSAVVTRAGRKKLVAMPVAKKRGFFVKNVDSIAPLKEIVDSPVRATRSRAQIVREGVRVENKRGKRRGKDAGGNDRPPPFIDLTENVASETDDVGKEIKGPARRSSRKRGAVNEIEKHFEGANVVGSRKSMRRCGPDAKCSNILIDNKDLAKDGGVAPTEMVSRRSKRIMEKTADFEIWDEAKNEPEMVGRGRSTRSCSQQAVKASSAESKSKSGTKVESNRRHRSPQKMTVKSTSKLTQDKGPAKDGRVAQPEMGFRRSKRNMENIADSEMLGGAEAKSEIFGRGRTTRSHNQKVAHSSAVETEASTGTKFKIDTRHRNPEKKILKSTEKLTEDKGSGKHGQLGQQEKVLRRSNRNVKQTEDFAMLRGAESKPEMVERGRISRSLSQPAGNFTSVQRKSKTKTEVEVNEKSEVLQFEEPLQREDSNMLKGDKGDPGKFGTKRNTRSRNQQAPKVENESNRVASDNPNVVLQLEKPLQRASRNVDCEKSLLPQTSSGNEAPGQSKEVLLLNESQRRLGSASVGWSTKKLVKENEMISSPSSTLRRSRRQCVVDSMVPINEESVPSESGSRNKRQKQSAETPASKQFPFNAEPGKRLTRSASRLGSLTTPDHQGKTIYLIGKSKQRKGIGDPILEQNVELDSAGPVEEKMQSTGNPELIAAEVPGEKILPGALKSSMLPMESPLPADILARDKLPAMGAQFSMKVAVEASKTVASSKKKNAYGEAGRKSASRSYSKDTLVVELETSFTKEDGSGSQSLGDAGGFSSNELIDAEPVRDSSGPADEGFSKIPFAGYGESAIDQTDNMAYVKEMEIVEEPSSAKVTVPSPVGISHGDDSSTYVHEQKFVESEELVHPQQFGEANFAEHSNKETLNAGGLQNRDVNDIDKFIDSAQEQPYVEERLSISEIEEAPLGHTCMQPNFNVIDNDFADAVSAKPSGRELFTEDTRDIDLSGGSSGVSEGQTQNVETINIDNVPVLATVFSAPADEAFAKIRSAGDSGLLIDQADFMGNMEGIETKRGPSTNKVLQPSPVLLDRDVEGSTSPIQEQNHVEFHDCVDFAAPSANESVTEVLFKQSEEVNFVDQSEVVEFTASKLENKNLDNCEKFLREAEVQQSRCGLKTQTQSLEVEEPSTESVFVVEKLHSEASSISVQAPKKTSQELFEEHPINTGGATNSNLFEVRFISAHKEPSKDLGNTERFVDTDEMLSSYRPGSQNLEGEIPFTESITGEHLNEDTELILSETDGSASKSVTRSSNEVHSGTETSKSSGRSLVMQHILPEACAEISGLEGFRELKRVHLEENQSFEPMKLENELVNLEKDATISDLEVFEDRKDEDTGVLQKTLNLEQSPPNKHQISGDEVQAINVVEDHETYIPDQEVYYDAELDKGGDFKEYGHVFEQDTAISMPECSHKENSSGDMLKDMDVDNNGSTEAGHPKESMTDLENLPSNPFPGSVTESESSACGPDSLGMTPVKASIPPKHKASSFLADDSSYRVYALRDCDESQTVLTDSEVWGEKLNQRDPKENLEMKDSDQEELVNRNVLADTDEEIIKDGSSGISNETSTLFERPDVGKAKEMLGENVHEDDQLFSKNCVHAVEGPKPSDDDINCHEHLLEELSSTPIKATQCSEEIQVPSHEAEFVSSTEEMTISNMEHGELNQELAPQVVRAKEIQHEKIIEEGHASLSKGDKITEEGCSSVKGSIQLTSGAETPLCKTLHGDFKVAQEQMPSEHENTSKCIKEGEMLMDRTEVTVLPVGSVGLDNVAYHHAGKSATGGETANLIDSVEESFEQGSSGFARLSHSDAEEKFSVPTMEVHPSRGSLENVLTKVIDGNDQENSEVNFVESHNYVFPEVSVGNSSAMKKGKGEEFLETHDEFDQTTGQIGATKLYNFAYLDTTIFHELDKSSSLSLSERIIVDDQDDEVLKKSSVDAPAGLKHFDDLKINDSDSGKGFELSKACDVETQMWSPGMNLFFGDAVGDEVEKSNAGHLSSSYMYAGKIKENVASRPFGEQAGQPHYMEEVAEVYPLQAGGDVASSSPEKNKDLVEVDKSERMEEMDSKGAVTESPLRDE